MPDTSNKFRCWHPECGVWFTLHQARTEKHDSGTSLSIYCPVCLGYVEKIQRVLTGRGTNLEPRDVVHPIPANKPALPPPANLGLIARVQYIAEAINPDPPVPAERLSHWKKEPCGMGKGDHSPRMVRYVSGNRDMAETFALATRRVSKKRVTTNYDWGD